MTCRGVVLVMYDLPVTSAKERATAVRFRKKLLGLGYVSMQKSVYVKLLRSFSATAAEIKKVDSIKPHDGLIHVLPLKLSDFRRLAALTGNRFDISVFSDDILVIL